LKKAYFTKCLEYHPDKCTFSDAKEKFQRLQQIWAVLKSPQKRADYDRFGELDDDEGLQEEGEVEEVEDDNPVEFTVEEIQKFLDSFQLRVSAVDVHNSLEFESSMNPASVYTEEILLREIQRATSVTVTHLELSGKSIKTLPAEFGSLVALKKLNLHKNKLTTLPKELQKLTRLSHLILSVNKFNTIPDVLFDLPNLTVLNLDHNQIVTIPHQISKLTELIELKLFANKLKDLPVELAQLKNLAFLDVELNFISQVPRILRENKSLKILLQPSEEDAGGGDIVPVRVQTKCRTNNNKSKKKGKTKRSQEEVSSSSSDRSEPTKKRQKKNSSKRKKVK